ncbi:putative disease resistance RPP13-like protein 1 [Typha latifolia]|uniref:putative disease resistance RPP13-like protein 1 n=1 Tax=Typha latifolia TaxID=4733 RepID=UPI003C2E7189
MAEMAIIGWFVSPTIKEMISKARSYLGTLYNWNTRMKNDLERLDTIMMEILLVVSNAERRQITDSNQAILLQFMKDAVYDAEDALDEFDYLLIQSQSRATSSVSCFCDAEKYLLGSKRLRKNLSKALKSLERVKSSAKRLLDVTMLESIVQQPGIMQRRPTSSLPSQDAFIGRDKLCEEIIKRLVESSCNEAESSSSGEAAPIVLPITGVGGVGKTTLAQHIYNADQVASRFTKIWICVSDYFDEMKLTKEILTYASKPKNDFDINNSNFSKLQEELQQKLESEKYLLVLDDVWDDPDPKVGKPEIKDRWMKFLAPLKCNRKGSAILVTTRVGLMAEILCSKKSEIFNLEGLNGNDSWQLFSSHALPLNTGDTPQMREIERIGKQIVEKLKGLPLALKVVGEQLNGNHDAGEWKEVLQSGLSDDIMKVLKLSYEHLPRNLQQCFAYCSLFPKDWLFEPDWLVQMWIAQGFIHPRDDGTNVTQVGKEHFTDLCNKSFFQTLKRDGKTYYVMHDMMNDLALSVSRRECCRIESNDCGDIPSTVRHLSITNKQAHRLESMVEMRNLRTLIVFDASFSWFCSKVAPKDDMFGNLVSVRVLVLTGYCMKQLPRVDGLIHLRYLALPITHGESSLDAFSCLYHLQVLVIHHHSCVNWSSVIFPQKMNRLINMQHVYFNGAIGEFHVQKKKSNTSGVLKGIHGDIHGNISIKYLENIVSKEEPCEARLSSKDHINLLSLEWSPSNHRSCEHEAEILDSLQPHQNLGALTIMGYGGSRSPFWLEINWFCKLHSLYLDSCKGWRELPPLGHLPFLKILGIRSMNALTHVGSEFYGNGEVKGFPALEELRFEDMPEWVEWSGLRGTRLFPSLHNLQIYSCPKLKEMPAFSLLLDKRILTIHPEYFPFVMFYLRGIEDSKGLLANSITCLTIMHPDNLKAVEELNIIEGGEPMTVKNFRELLSLKKLKIENCFWLSSSREVDLFPQSLECLCIKSCRILPDILSGDQNLERGLPWALDLQHLTRLVKLDIIDGRNLTALTGVNTLTSLEELLIVSCNDLLSLPSELSGLRSLKKLHVAGCRKLRSLPENGLPLSLKSACIWRCHPILQEQLDKMEGPEFDKFDRFVKLNKDGFMRTLIEKFKLDRECILFKYEDKVLLLQLLATLAADGNQTKTELVKMLHDINTYDRSNEGLAERIRMFTETLESMELSLVADGNEIEIELIKELIFHLHQIQCSNPYWDENETESWELEPDQ